MQRKLEPNVKWISDFAIHSGGDNIIVGDYSARLAWIDTGLLFVSFRLKILMEHVTCYMYTEITA